MDFAGVGKNIHDALIFGLVAGPLAVVCLKIRRRQRRNALKAVEGWARSEGYKLVEAGRPGRDRGWMIRPGQQGFSIVVLDPAGRRGVGLAICGWEWGMPLGENFRVEWDAEPGGRHRPEDDRDLL